jgi:23S rRNA pseudouridine955/2504/2580 synthase
MQSLRKNSVTWVQVGDESAGQRIDNFLLGELKGVPKSHVYRILRSGEVRVNSGRVDATYRLAEGDRIRIPPVRQGERPTAPESAPKKGGASLLPQVIYDDGALMALNKPAGMAVHGGSGISLGVIEQLRLELPDARFLELVHRLDRDTSGVLLLARKRSALTAMHALMQAGGTDKRYLVLAKGQFKYERKVVKESLHKTTTSGGERRVVVRDEGQPSQTILRRIRQFEEATLLEARLITGRTHQIRVHLAHLASPIAGDDKYGDFEWNRKLARQGLKRMFLHAASLAFRHPLTGQPVRLEAPLPKDLARFLDTLKPLAPDHEQAL